MRHSTLVAGLMGALVLTGWLAPVATAQTASFGCGLSGSQKAGVDSFYVGGPITIRFRVDGTGVNIGAVDFPTRWTFTNGNLVGPVTEPTGFHFTGMGGFALTQFDSAYGVAATDPDTLAWSAAGGNLRGGIVADLSFTPHDTGTIHIDSVRLPSGTGLRAVDTGGAPLPLAWAPRTIHVVPGELRFQVRSYLYGLFGPSPLVKDRGGRLSFEIVSTGLTVRQIEWPALYTFTHGNAIGPLVEGVSVLPGADAGLFDSMLWGGDYENATDPDTTLVRLVSNTGVFLQGTYKLWTIEFTPATTDTIVIDSLTLPTGESLSAIDSLGAPLNVIWSPATVPVLDHIASFEITTQLGNDTMFAHQEGNIIVYLNAAGWNLSAVTMPIEFIFGGAGNLIGPITEAAGPAVFSYSAYAQEKMENRPFNAILGNVFTGDPDTLLFGALDFNGDGWDADGELARITFTPKAAGTIQIWNSSVPPACCVSVLDQNASDILFDFHGPHTITVLPCPVMMGDVNNDLVINTADLIYMVNYIFKSGPDPLPMRTVGDANCSGGLGGSDIIYLVNYIFKGGQPPCACYKRII